MSVLEKPFFDGFGWTTSSANLALRWSYSDATIGTTNGPFGDCTVSLPITTPLSKIIPASAVGLIQAYFKISDNRSTVIASFDDNSVNHLQLVVNASGEFELYRDQYFNGNILQTSSGVGIVRGQWYYIKFKALISDSPTGQWQVDIGGRASVLAGTGDTRNGGTTTITKAKFYGSNPSGMLAHALIDWGSTWAGVAMIPEKRVIYCPVSAVVDDDFTPNTGTNLTAVDDTSSDGDTTYTASSTVGNKESFTYDVSGIPSGVSISHVHSMHLMRKDDAGTRFVRAFSGTVDSDVDSDLGASYNFVANQITVDPATGLAFANAAALGSTKFGIRIAS